MQTINLLYRRNLEQPLCFFAKDGCTAECLVKINEQHVHEFLMKTKAVIIGVILGVILISYEIFTTPASGRWDTFFSGPGLLMSLGVLCGAAFSALIVEKYLRLKKGKVGRIWGGIIGSILISPLALVFGIVFSPLGIGYGELLGGMIGMSQIGSYVGLFVAIILMVILVESAGVGIGAFLGSLIQSVIWRCCHYVKK
jgi:hypothetical protein